jgi:hypothetical protein
MSICKLKVASAKFEEHSSYGIFNGCAGALDGWLCQI